MENLSKRFWVWGVSCLLAAVMCIPIALIYGYDHVTKTDVLLFWVLINQLLEVK